MGRSLLTTLESQSLPDYAMVIVVSDFQDSVEGSFCETLGKLAERKRPVIVLESVSMKWPRKQVVTAVSAALHASDTSLEV